MIRVATDTKPTNERIAEKLDRVLQEVAEVKEIQDQIVAELRRLEVSPDKK